jgi:hypothetical protein
VSAPTISEAEGGDGRRGVAQAGAALGRLRPEEEESRVGQVGPVGRLRPNGEGESGLAGEEGMWPRLGRKPELGQSSRNKILSNFIWNLHFWQALEICTRKFRRNFDMGIFPKIF